MKYLAVNSSNALINFYIGVFSFIYFLQNITYKLEYNFYEHIKYDVNILLLYV